MNAEPCFRERLPVERVPDFEQIDADRRAAHAAYMREWRRGHPLSDEARRRDIARSYASVYRRRGLLTREPCRHCGAEETIMHHDDYARPLDVVWLCRPCHRRHHRDHGRPGEARYVPA
jgi:hypothetical protein